MMCDRSPMGLVLAMLMLSVGCIGRAVALPMTGVEQSVKNPPRMFYTIQVGAFSKRSNAIQLTESLEVHDLDPYYFLHESGLYKVRFGHFVSREAAVEYAERFCQSGTINDYYIVNPEDYSAVAEGHAAAEDAVAEKEQAAGTDYLRDEIVTTAKRFIGIPYRWGGTSPKSGFDCSGLAMVVYQLNGLNLPRSSRKQFSTGAAIAPHELMLGDLVFFTTSGTGTVSHVGIYAGDNQFIHAPGRGKRIRTDSLSNNYFKIHYAGARTYL